MIEPWVSLVFFWALFTCGVAGLWVIASAVLDYLDDRSRHGRPHR